MTIFAQPHTGDVVFYKLTAPHGTSKLRRYVSGLGSSFYGPESLRNHELKYRGRVANHIWQHLRSRKSGIGAN
jgi:hypothetical protein